MEELLMSWIQMAVIIRGNRLLNELSLNEMIICNVINTNENTTAALLCERTKLLKSQMNRLLTQMENSGLIVRKPAEDDKRKIYISLTEKGKQIYNKEHQNVLSIVGKVSDSLGPTQTKQLAELMQKAVNAINKGEKND